MRISAKGLLGLATAMTLVAAPAYAAATIDTKAQAALTAMQTLNVVVLGNWTVGNSGDVEGKAYVGGNVSGNKLTIGTGRSTAGVTSSSYSTLTVGGNMTNGASITNGTGANSATMGGYGLTVIGSASGSDGITFNNASSTTNINKGLTGGTLTTGASSTVNINSGGATNVSLGTSSTANIGGNVTNLTTSDSDKVVVTGQLGGGNMNLNGANMSLQAASYTGNVNGLGSGSTAKISGNNPSQNSPPSGWSFNVSQTLNAPAAATLATSATVMASNMQDLTSQLSSLAVNGTVTNTGDSQNAHLNFNVTNTTAGYAVFTVTAAQLALSSTTLTFNTNGSTAPIIVNVTGVGSGFTWNASSTSSSISLAQQIIYNFVGTTASTVNTTTEIYGSVLDAYGTLNNGNAIDGSVVANVFNQNGEVHLATFDGGDTSTASIVKLSTVPAVPETPAWIMMIFGFGFIGRMIRRQREQQEAMVLPVFG